MKLYTKRVIKIINSIPEGEVMTYGQIAEIAGSKRGARQVVRILHTMSDTYKLPWHRVVNAKGEIAIKNEESRFIQKHNLLLEGVGFDNAGRVELNRFLY